MKCLLHTKWMNVFGIVYLAGIWELSCIVLGFVYCCVHVSVDYGLSPAYTILEERPSDKDELSSPWLNIIANIPAHFHWKQTVECLQAFTTCRLKVSSTKIHNSLFPGFLLRTFLHSHIPLYMCDLRTAVSHFNYHCTAVWLNAQLWKSQAPAFNQNCAGVTFRETQGTMVSEWNRLSWINRPAGETWQSAHVVCFHHCCSRRPCFWTTNRNGVCKLSGSKFPEHVLSFQI